VSANTSTPLDQARADARPPLSLRVVPRGRALPLGALLGGLALFGLLLAGVFHVDRLGLTVCMLKGVTGIPCPTCGGTRALAHLAQLDLAGAFALNPLVTLGFAALVPWALADLALMRRGRALDLELSGRGALWAGLVAGTALLLNWIYLLASGR
jgi:hypothetical protein